MLCPRDGSELKAKIYEANIEIDECPRCEGMFLDNGELEAIQKATEKDYKDEIAKPADSMRDEFKAQKNEELGLIKCPQCGAEMDRRRYGLGSQTVIDVCAAGCGLWLDAGELAELEKFYEKSQEEVTIPLMWRVWAAVRGRVVKKK